MKISMDNMQRIVDYLKSKAVEEIDFTNIYQHTCYFEGKNEDTKEEYQFSINHEGQFTLRVTKEESL